MVHPEVAGALGFLIGDNIRFHDFPGIKGLRIKNPSGSADEMKIREKILMLCTLAH
jgi:hypothetical protein